MRADTGVVLQLCAAFLVVVLGVSMTAVSSLGVGLALLVGGGLWLLWTTRRL